MEHTITTAGKEMNGRDKVGISQSLATTVFFAEQAITIPPTTC